MEHPRGVVLLHILVNSLDLLVARDEQRVVSGTEEEDKEIIEYKGFVRRNKKGAGVFTRKCLCSYWG